MQGCKFNLHFVSPRLLHSLTTESWRRHFNANGRSTALVRHRMAELVTFNLFAGVAVVVWSALLGGIKVGSARFAVQRIYVADGV